MKCERVLKIISHLKSMVQVYIVSILTKLTHYSLKNPSNLGQCASETNAKIKDPNIDQKLKDIDLKAKVLIYQGQHDITNYLIQLQFNSIKSNIT